MAHGISVAALGVSCVPPPRAARRGGAPARGAPALFECFQLRLNYQITKSPLTPIRPSCIVDDAQGADSCCGQIIRCRRAETARTDHQDFGLQQFCLTFFSDFGKEEMPAVADQLFRGILKILHPFEAAVFPGRITARH